MMFAAYDVIQFEARNVIAAADGTDMRFDAQRLQLFASHTDALLLPGGV